MECAGARTVAPGVTLSADLQRYDGAPPLPSWRPPLTTILVLARRPSRILTTAAGARARSASSISTRRRWSGIGLRSRRGSNGTRTIDRATPRAVRSIDAHRSLRYTSRRDRDASGGRPMNGRRCHGLRRASYAPKPHDAVALTGAELTSSAPHGHHSFP